MLTSARGILLWFVQYFTKYRAVTLWHLDKYLCWRFFFIRCQNCNLSSNMLLFDCDYYTSIESIVVFLDISKTMITITLLSFTCTWLWCSKLFLNFLNYFTLEKKVYQLMQINFVFLTNFCVFIWIDRSSENLDVILYILRVSNKFLNNAENK